MGNNFVENYESLSDDEIIAEINSGNYELLRIIIKRYLPVIWHYVNKYCGEAEREDAAQEASFALYSAVKKYNPELSSFTTFADLCIKRSVLSNLKTSQRKKNIPDELVSQLEDVEISDCNSPEKIFFEKESYKTLTDSIKLELSDMEYKVLQLFLSGKKYADIAEELKISEKSVDNSLARIRRKLKNK